MRLVLCNAGDFNPALSCGSSPRLGSRYNVMVFSIYCIRGRLVNNVPVNCYTAEYSVLRPVHMKLGTDVLLRTCSTEYSYFVYLPLICRQDTSILIFPMSPGPMVTSLLATHAGDRCRLESSTELKLVPIIIICNAYVAGSQLSICASK